MNYTFNIPDLNVKLTAHNVINSALFYSPVQGHFYRSEVSNGNSFNLWNWVRDNIYLPNYNAGRTITRTVRLITMRGDNGSSYANLEFTFNATSDNKSVSFRTIRSDGTHGNTLTYNYSRPINESFKMLDILVYEPYKFSNGDVWYHFTFNIGDYGIDTLDSSSNVVQYKSKCIFSELVYSNEIYDNYLGGMNNNATAVSFQGYSNDLERVVDLETSESNPDDDYSGEGGGKGVVDDRSDYIPTDGVPLVSGIRSGFINLYAPTLTQIKSLHDFLMGDSFLNNVKKLIANPIDYIISLHLLPVHPTTDGSESIAVGGIDTLVQMAIVPTQYMEFDCGTLNVDEYWGSFIDYSPFTKVSIFLPFVGIKELNLDDVMSSQLKVIYRIDVLTGNFTCNLHVISSRKVNAVLYNYSGNMSMSIPISATDYRQKVSAFTQLVGSGAMVAVSGGTSPSADIGFASNLANVALSKYGYSRSGNITGDASLLGNYTPYLIISRPNQSLPSKYKGLNGYTSNIGGTVGQFSGYNEFREVKTDGLTCLEEEKQMIVDLLQSGVFV